MGFLILLIICMIVLWGQFKYSRKVKIHEKYSRNYLIMVRVIAALFVLWGLFFLQSGEFILITTLTAIVFIFHPYTTGLSRDKIIYREMLGGFASLSPKTQNISDVYDISTKEDKDSLKLTFNIKNQFNIEMFFAKKDKEKVFKFLQDI